MRSGFRKDVIRSRGLRAGRRLPREHSSLNYHLYTDDARAWHADSCAGADCWCADADDFTFLSRLRDRIRHQGYRSGMKAIYNGQRLLLVGRPGIDDGPDQDRIIEAVRRA